MVVLGAVSLLAASCSTALPGNALPASLYVGGTACPSPSECVVVGSLPATSAVVLSINDGSPGAPRSVAGSHLAAVACSSTTSCVAVGLDASVEYRTYLGSSGDVSTTGEVVPIANGVPAVPEQVPGADLLAVTCAGGSCVAVGYDTATVGLATANDGVVVPITAGVPGRVQVVPGAALDQVACADAAHCVATGRGMVAFITNGTPSSVKNLPDDDVKSLACADAHHCVAVGTRNSFDGVVLPIKDGRVGKSIEVAGNNSLNGVTCPDPRTCLAVGSDNSVNGGGVVVITHGVPGPVQGVPLSFALDDISCVSATTCIAGGYQQLGSGEATYNHGIVVPILDGVPGGRHVVPGSSGIDGPICAPGGICTGIPGSGSTQTVVTFKP